MTVLILVCLLAVISITLHRTGTLHALLTYQQEDGEAAYYAAMAGVQHALFVLKGNSKFTGPLAISGLNELPFGKGSYTTTVTDRNNMSFPGNPQPVPPMGRLLISSTGNVGNTARTIEKWVCPAAMTEEIVLRNNIDDKDTCLRANSAERSYGGSSELRIGSNGRKGQRAAFEFDLNSIPADAIILSATLEIYMYGNASGNAGSHLEVEAHRIVSSWDEGDEIGDEGDGACWKYSSKRNRWINLGADFDSTVVSTANILYDDIHQWHAWDMTTLVQGWLEGIIPNYGLILKDADEGAENEDASMEALFYSRESLQVNLRPKLTVVYE